jgi:hypothetical protein
MAAERFEWRMWAVEGMEAEESGCVFTGLGGRLRLSILAFLGRLRRFARGGAVV